MAATYLLAADWFKKRNFEVLVPAFYHPYMPKEMLNPNRDPLPRVNRYRMVPTRRRSNAPFHQPVDPMQMQRASYSVEIFIDMFQKKIEFEITPEDQIPEIFDGLDWYLNSIKHEVDLGEERYVEYARKVISFRAEMYKHYYRYMMTHPTAMNTLYPNNDKKKNILHLMSLTAGVREQREELDPLRAKEKPPYDVDKTKPKEKEDTQVDGFETSLGISRASELLQDDGRDFNFDDFLKRG